MAGIMNNTARQFNLKCMSKTKHRVVVRLAPGFNVVKDEHWCSFVPKGGKVDPYVAELKADGFIDFGPKQDDRELDDAPDTVSKSKSTPPVTSPNIPEKVGGASTTDINTAVAAAIAVDKAKTEAEAKTEAKTEAGK